MSDGGESRRFVLIGGMPRSGTTLMETVVGSHPRVAIPPGDFPFAELAASGLSVDQIFSAMQKKATWSFWRVKELESLVDQDYRDAFRKTLIRYADGIDKDIAGAKAPYSEFYLDTIRSWLSDDDMKFIYVLRNPFDVMASIKHSKIHSSWKAFTDLIEVQARNWVRSTTIILARTQQEPLNFKIVRYEHLLEDPMASCAELCKFLGVDFEPDSMLNRIDYDYHDTNTSFPEQFENREDKDSYIYPAESRKTKLSDEEIRLISETCGETAMSLGYADPDLAFRPPERMRKFSNRTKLRRLSRRIHKKIFR
jgi:hypothetical protein